jgi:hypothetical protein
MNIHPLTRSPRGRRRTAAVIGATGLAAGALAALPAHATITNIEPGHNITVFHNIDFVAVTGWADGEALTVEVRRGNAVIGTAAGNASDPEATGASGLEVNHGPEGAPLPGDCWEGATPDIRPGDVITVSNGTLTDEVTVDDIRFTGDPVEAADGDILVPFVARRANGNAIPAGFLDSPEFRAGSDLRFEATDIRVQRVGAVGSGNYVMRYNSPFRPSRNRNNVPQRQMRRLLLGDGHAIGFGHTDPVPAEAMLHDGLTDAPGPAPGCPGGSAQWTANAAAPGAINVTNRARGLTVRGLSHDASGVSVSLNDNDPTTPAGALTAAATLSSDTGVQQWRANFTRRQLRNLNRRIRVAVTFSLNGGGSFVDRSLTVVKDVVRPNQPRASLQPGAYNRTRRVALRSRGNQIRYTIGNGKQAAPTARSGLRYRGRIGVSSTQVIKAVSVDRAGNVSRVARLRYRIR